MYVVTVEFEVKSDNVTAFREAIRLQASTSLIEEGCQQFDVCFDPERASRCFLYEKYDDRAAFDKHLASKHFQEFDATVAPWIVRKNVQTWQHEN